MVLGLGGWYYSSGPKIFNQLSDKKWAEPADGVGASCQLLCWSQQQASGK